MSLPVTDKVLMVLVGGAAVVACVGLLTGATFQDMAIIITAFGFGSILPSPLKKSD